MITGFTLDLLVILVGFAGMVWLLTGLFGTHAPIVPYAEPFSAEEESPAMPSDAEEPLISMPEHLKTHAEMVAWMTQELPRLTEGMATRPQGD